ncbi:GIY-YIG nuclease family protein [Simiduia curdlanivorans]|uniref:GIY-YIG nuclease family protein n=1 Tax=Simiduia curdlanivorans TaxID=1492769 RepID=A0ABV8V3Z3_9GAMM|nr:GIY-YIG nuclease family protein [Simiduia curdlanivorans]MDN3640100.1 GIY-YIG nuclease family protein [Simiduia curdlanivorans]
MATTPVNTQSTWVVYIILASDNSLYTGICTDLDRRFNEHANGQGAKYFRGRTPLRVCFQENHPDRSTASKREWQIKRLSRTEKLRLIDLREE